MRYAHTMFHSHPQSIERVIEAQIGIRFDKWRVFGGL